MVATITKGTTYSATETITNAKLHALVDSAAITGIVNAEIDASAGIAYSKLALTNSLLNADVSTSANISIAKLDHDSIIFWQDDIISYENEIVYIS